MTRLEHIALQRGLVEGQRVDGAQPLLVQRGVGRGAAQEEIGQDEQQAEDDEPILAAAPVMAGGLRHRVPPDRRGFAGQRAQEPDDQVDFPRS